MLRLTKMEQDEQGVKPRGSDNVSIVKPKDETMGTEGLSIANGIFCRKSDFDFFILVARSIYRVHGPVSKVLVTASLRCTARGWQCVVFTKYTWNKLRSSMVC